MDEAHEAHEAALKWVPGEAKTDLTRHIRTGLSRPKQDLMTASSDRAAVIWCHLSQENLTKSRLEQSD
jgi:hypothetical protein